MHWHTIWEVSTVRALVADRTHTVSFFCRGSRNFRAFIGLVDTVLVLEADRETLTRRLAARPGDEFGRRRAERELVLRPHSSGDGTPQMAAPVEATRPLPVLVDEILARCR